MSMLSLLVGEFSYGKQFMPCLRPSHSLPFSQCMYSVKTSGEHQICADPWSDIPRSSTTLPVVAAPHELYELHLSMPPAQPYIYMSAMCDRKKVCCALRCTG